MRVFRIALISLMALSFQVNGNTPVTESVHNLSVSGPGKFKSQSVDDVCIFCHAPHSSNPMTGAWNRRLRPFVQYQSSTTDALPGRQNLTSELCLSCHDGTIALGELLVQPKNNKFSSNDLRGIFLSGRGRFGSDLTNHHPVAITYDSSLLASDPDLVNPNAIDLPLSKGELHCTSCHDPHDPGIPPFLRKTTLNGELCITCHAQRGSDWEWSTSAHAQSDAKPRGADPWRDRKPEWKGLTTAENACMNCHTPHNAATPARLINDREEQTCYRCHNGSFAMGNIQSDIQKFSRHPVDGIATGRHDSARIENPFSMPLHVECEDCHNPHATRSDLPMISFNPGNPLDPNHTVPPQANGVILGVSGIDINGAPIAEVDYEYEVCFKCHGVPGKSACDNFRCSTAEGYRMQRQDEVYNIRDKVDPSNSSLESYHPIDTNNPANNDEVPSLRRDIPLNRSASRIYCSDCHSGEFSPAAGGNAAGGPHGSRHDGLLALRYEFNPGSSFGASKDALCLKCHDASSLYGDESFPHRKHVLDEGTSCINCHDPHGSTVYPHLINFLTSSSVTGRILEISGAGTYTEPTWIDKGRYSGTCYLNCHGKVHDGTSY